MAHRFLKPGPLLWGVCSPLGSREFHGAGLPSFLGQKPCLGPSLCRAGLRLLTLAGPTAATITFVWDPQACENALCSSLQGLISKYPEQSSSNQTTDLVTNQTLSPSSARPKQPLCCSVHASGDSELSPSQEILFSLYGSRSPQACPSAF